MNVADAVRGDIGISKKPEEMAGLRAGQKQEGKSVREFSSLQEQTQ